jgi:hypothetical protein
VTDNIEAPSDVGPKPEDVASHWIEELDIADRTESAWRKEAKRVLAIYQPESKSKGKKAAFNILYSNTQTLAPALYSNTPRPDVRKRYRDEDKTGGEVAEVIERSLSFTVDAYDFDAEMKQVVRDYLLPGRAVARVKYEPTFRQETPQLPVEINEFGIPLVNGFGVDPEAIQQDEQGSYVDGEPEDVKDFEEVSCETVPYDDFRMSPAKNWAQVRWIAFLHRMTRDELNENKFEDAANVPMDVEDDTLGNDETSDSFKRAEVWEIWDKDKRQVLFVNKGSKKPLRVVDDPLQLQRFFPIPKPLYSIQGSSMVPTPEYLIYEKLAEELDEVTKRIASITKALKVRGVYDATQEEIATILQQPDNTLVPANNFAMLLEKGGLSKAVEFLDISTLAQVLNQLYLNRDQVKQTIFEITGVSDILRGQTNPNETATAQSIKAQFGSLRLEDRQKDVARFARDLMRLKAEVIAEHFSPESLSQMTGREVTPEMTEIMSSDTLRGFRIDIETDSTIAVDQASEQEAVTKLLSGVMEFLTGAVPLVQAGALTKEAAQSFVLMAVRRFRGSREVEDVINSMTSEGEENNAEAQLQQMQQQMQQMQQQGQEMQQALQEAQSGQAEAQKKLEIEQGKAQAKIQVDQMVAQAKASLDEQMVAAKIDREDGMAQLEARLNELESEAKIEREDFKAHMSARLQERNAEVRQ